MVGGSLRFSHRSVSTYRYRRIMAPSKKNNAPSDESAVKNADPVQIARFVTTIKNAEQQIGEHIVAALQHADPVAVLTTVVVGPGGEQHLVSAARNPSKMAEINQLLQSAIDEREDEELCFGFHCLVKPKRTAETDSTTE